jgi:hypothetical protein
MSISPVLDYNWRSKMVVSDSQQLVASTPSAQGLGAPQLRIVGTSLSITLSIGSRMGCDTRGQNPFDGFKGSRARSLAPQAGCLRHQGRLQKVHLVEAGLGRQSLMVRASEQRSRMTLRAPPAPRQLQGPSAPLQAPPGL